MAKFYPSSQWPSIKTERVYLSRSYYSLPSKNRFTTDRYNTGILARLLGKWKSSLGQRNGHSFSAKVAITDSDSKERNALFQVFPNIWLSLCKFHPRQCWTNHCNRHLRGDAPIVGAPEIAIRLVRLEESLIRTLEHSEAVVLIESEKETLQLLKAMEASALAAAEAGIAHLNYYEPVWKSWSKRGRHIAAALSGCTFEGVLPTTNHLESFNEVLKNKRLHRRRRNNRPLRLDVSPSLLALKILPSIFDQRALDLRQRGGWETSVRAAALNIYLSSRKPTRSLTHHQPLRSWRPTKPVMTPPKHCLIVNKWARHLSISIQNDLRFRVIRLAHFPSIKTPSSTTSTLTLVVP